jgi:biopolymer transport protein ExbB
LLKALALSGGDWVIWGLFASSAVAVAVIVERAIVFKKELEQFAKLEDSFLRDPKGAEKAIKAHPGSAARILGRLLEQTDENVLVAAGLQEKRFIEHRLIILGTLGNNAPFVGLFGTVLGVIRAFHDLASQAGAGPEVVMQGLSEALIATAVGLLVAIPCVVAYNYFQKRAKDLLSGTEALGRLLLARVRA